MSYEIIESDEQYYQYLQDYKDIQINIGLAYSRLRNTSPYLKERVIFLQDYIARYTSISEGIFGLLSAYNVKQTSVKTKIHIVQQNDSLPLLAKIYYNDANKWQQIYIKNELQSLNLTIGQELIIPDKNYFTNTIYQYGELEQQKRVNEELGFVDERGKG